MRSFARAIVNLAIIAGLAFSVVTAQETQKAPETKAKKKAADGTKYAAFKIPKEITLTEKYKICRTRGNTTPWYGPELSASAGRHDEKMDFKEKSINPTKQLKNISHIMGYKYS